MWIFYVWIMHVFCSIFKVQSNRLFLLDSGYVVTKNAVAIGISYPSCLLTHLCIVTGHVCQRITIFVYHRPCLWANQHLCFAKEHVCEPIPIFDKLYYPRPRLWANHCLCIARDHVSKPILMFVLNWPMFVNQLPSLYYQYHRPCLWANHPLCFTIDHVCVPITIFVLQQTMFVSQSPSL